MWTIRMPRGHSIDKCDLVRVSHMMLLSRTARRNLGKRGAEQTQYPWHFRPANQLTADRRRKLSRFVTRRYLAANSSKIKSWYNSPFSVNNVNTTLIPFPVCVSFPSNIWEFNHDQECHEHLIPSETSPCRDSSSHDKMASIHESGPSSQSRSQAIQGVNHDATSALSVPE